MSHEEENLVINNMEVISEVVVVSIEDEKINKKALDLQKIDVSFLPLVTDEEEKITSRLNETTEVIKRDKATFDVNLLDVVFEKVTFKVDEVDGDINFLPLIVEETKTPIDSPEELDILYEEVLDVPFVNINFDDEELKLTDIVLEEKLIPKCIEDINSSELLKVDVVFEQIVFNETIKSEDLIAIDWSTAFNDVEAQEQSSVIETSKITDCSDLTVNKSPSSIPNAWFYENEIMETMVLLENIAELGDHREIPYLKLLLEKENSADVQDRIRVMIKHFTENYTGIEYFNVTQFEVADSVFNELMEKSDLESKLILLKEIVEVGDEKELPLLNSMLLSDNAVLRKKAKACLKRLTERLVKEDGEVVDDTLLETNSENGDVFQIAFAVNKSKSRIKQKSTSHTSARNSGTLFDHLCAVSTKLYDKFNG
jgi:hypothetical protein